MTDPDWIAIAALSLLGIATLAGALRRDRCPESESGRHSWDYGNRTIGGWGVVHCDDCDKTDIY